jgi:hypothetical protein
VRVIITFTLKISFFPLFKAITLSRSKITESEAETYGISALLRSMFLKKDWNHKAL